MLERMRSGRWEAFCFSPSFKGCLWAVVRIVWERGGPIAVGGAVAAGRNQQKAGIGEQAMPVFCFGNTAQFTADALRAAWRA